MVSIVLGIQGDVIATIACKSGTLLAGDLTIVSPQ